MADWVNAVIFLTGSACLTVALTFDDTICPFNSRTVIALWTVTGVLLVVFIIMLNAEAAPLVAKENCFYPLHFPK